MFPSVVVVVDVEFETSALEKEKDGAFGGTDVDETAVIVDGAESSATQAVKPNTTTGNKVSRTLTIFPIAKTPFVVTPLRRLTPLDSSSVGQQVTEATSSLHDPDTLITIQVLSPVEECLRLRTVSRDSQLSQYCLGFVDRHRRTRGLMTTVRVHRRGRFGLVLDPGRHRRS